MTPLVEARALARRFGELEVVRGVSLAIGRGESVALVGPSGCGKSTLLQLLGLLDRPSGGSLILDGEDPWSRAPSARAELRLRRLGFVFQQHNLLGHASARDNVSLPAWRLSGSRRQALARADELLERFGLDGRARAAAHQLSPGEAQRAAIARALVNRPDLLLADEPTGSLDSLSAARVLVALDEATAGGAALLLVTHDAEVAARADRVVRMRDGRLDGG